MSSKIFVVLFGLIIIIALLQRIVPTLGHNFHFTIDQGNDAVYVREIIERGQILIRGPETDISGFFAGPLWYYFIAIGYKISGGDPFGALLILIILNVALIGFVMGVISSRVSKKWGLLTGVMLLTSWWFFETSRYAFNPFILVTLSFILVFLLVDFILGKKVNFLLAAIPVGLGFHAEVAGSIPLLILYLLVGFWAVRRNKINLKMFTGGILVVSLFFIPYLVGEVRSGFSQTYSLLREFKQLDGAFSNILLITFTKYLFKQASQITFYHNQLVGDVLFFVFVVVAIRKFKNKVKLNKFVEMFSVITLVLALTTWVFFSSNNGWKDWQTIYIYPLIFISVLLLLSQIERKVALFFLIVMFLSQTKVFLDRYQEALVISDDPSILANELSAIDWVYQESNGRGFNVYSYVPPAVDYPYQYLFWWHGLKKYEYVPCDYSSYPGSPKPFYIPGSMYYENPQKECTKLRFLIIEPGKDVETRNNWLEGVRKGTNLISENEIGAIKIEKRILNDQAISKLDATR